MPVFSLLPGFSVISVISVILSNLRSRHLFFRPFLKFHEFVDAVNAGDRGLDGLNFHADALNRAEYLRNIVDHCNRSADGHSEERRNPGISGCSEDIDGADNDRICDENDGRVDRIVEVRAVHCPVTILNCIVVSDAHVSFTAERVNHSDIFDRFRNKIRDPGDGCAVFHICFQHAFLDRTGKPEHKRQYGKEQQGKAAVLDEQNHEDADDPAYIGEHADDSVRKQIFHSIHISDETRRDCTRILAGDCAGGKACELAAECAAECVCNLLPEYHEKTFSCGIKEPCQKKEPKIEKRKCKRNLCAVCEQIDDPLEDKRRHKGGDDGTDDCNNRQNGYNARGTDRAQNDAGSVFVMAICAAAAAFDPARIHRGGILKTYLIHHFTLSWQNPRMRFRRMRLHTFFGADMAGASAAGCTEPLSSSS